VKFDRGGLRKGCQRLICPQTALTLLHVSAISESGTWNLDPSNKRGNPLIAGKNLSSLVEQSGAVALL
jgi:hypothetical protein